MMGWLRNFWPLCLVIILSISFSEARDHHPHNKASAVVVGAVFCDTCFQDDMSKGSHYISGATVAVECEEGSSRPAFYQEIKTNEQGKFKVQLPFSISKHVKKIEGCTVKLLKSSEPYCAVASTATSSLIHLKDKKDGKHIFSAGFFTFKPLKQPGLCNQQLSVTNSQLNSLPIQPQQLFPPIIPPVLPAPQGPFPNPFQPPPLLPNPLQPPAPPLIPNPFQPQPTPAPLIPIPLQPPSPPATLLPPVPQLPNLPKLPPIPGLTPPPSPPPPVPTIPGLPGIPLLPPLIPGTPPLEEKKMNP